MSAATTPQFPSLTRKHFLAGTGLLVAASVLATQTGCSEHQENVASKLSVTSDVDADGAYQLSKTYPVPPESETFDDSLITNVTDSFTGFAGQGQLLFKADEPDAFRVFVNGKNVPLEQAESTAWTQFDISPLTRNGTNHLQVSCLDFETAPAEIRIPYPVLVDATAQYENNDTLKLLDQIIQAEIDHGFTSAQLFVARDGAIIKERAYGLCNSYDPKGDRLTDGAEVTNDTLYDLASNTKMYATNFALQKLVSDGDIDVTERVQTYIPEFRDQLTDAIRGKDILTVQEILEHQAGFPADPQYHNQDYDPAAKSTVSGSNANAALFTQDRADALAKIIATPLEYEPGTQTQYSDVDYMLLGFIVERVTGKRLDEYLDETFYTPLELSHVTFNPLQHGFDVDDCAATELNGNTRDGVVSFKGVRTDTIQGEVHDEKAYYTMEGVSGHAGLFSNAHDLGVLAQVMVNGGGYGTHSFFDKDVLDQFIKPKDSDPTYGLGWRRKAAQGYAWAFSPLADASTVGHTGWTGTLTAIDPASNTIVVLLTNAKNSPVLDNEANPNDFVGNHFLTSGYGMPATLCFDAITDSEDASAARLIDMIQAKYQLIIASESYDTEPDKAELSALLAVAKERQENGLIAAFKQTDAWQQAVELAE